MNMVLTQKDADFILGYLRESLQNCDDVIASLRKAEAEIKSDKNLGLGFLGDAIAKALSEDSEAFKKYQAEKAKLVKCIELLTVGSELLENA